MIALPFHNAVLRVAPGIADHLWQSTVFALGALILTKLLARGPAKVRFGILLAASAKFLVPFSLLVRLGQSLRPLHFAESVNIVQASTVTLLGHNSAGTGAGIARSALQLSTSFPNTPVLLAAAWFTGTMFVLLRWWTEWHQVQRLKRMAATLDKGREVEALRSLELATNVPHMPLLLSQTKLEPGVFGTVRPVLLWPVGLSDQLSDEQQKAIVAHEVWHARRRDNLAAALHMLVEAMFWFHPFVWWLGVCLIREREEACDEGVLSLGNEPSVYAESILAACKFCVQSPLPYVAGVSSSNLQQRIVRIMTKPVAEQLSSGRKVALASLAFVTIVAPVITGIVTPPPVRAQATQPTGMKTPVHLISIKRNQSGGPGPRIMHTAEGSTITNATLRRLIETAYGVRTDQISGGPNWIDSDHFDIAYTGGEPATPSFGFVPTVALQQILSQNFHLTLQRETRTVPAYALVVSGNSPTLINALPPATGPGATEPIISTRVAINNGVGHLFMSGSTPALADVLSSILSKQVTDKTGLGGTYDIMLHWSAAVGDSSEGLSSALKEQLGLALEPQQATVSQLTVSSAEEPAEL